MNKSRIESNNVPIFNIGTDNILTQEQVVKTIAEIFNLNIRVIERKAAVKEISKQSVNWTKIKELGWKPKYSFQTGINESIKRFRTYGWQQETTETKQTPKVEAHRRRP